MKTDKSYLLMNMKSVESCVRYGCKYQNSPFHGVNTHYFVCIIIHS